jgi:hypothetical protein
VNGRRDDRPLRVAVCAPVSLAEGEMTNRTAAFRKIRLILAALTDLGCDATLIESLHVGGPGGFRPTRALRAGLEDGREIKLLRLFALPVPRLTKAVQALAAPRIARRVARDFAPDLLWIYNGYLFEARLALKLARLGVPFVLELEDLPTARRSFPFNIKAALDVRLFDEVLRRAAAVLCVNSDLCARVRPVNPSVFLFPPIVDPALERRAAIRTPPFSRRPVRVGYCGGLEEDKGAGTLPALIDLLPPDMELHVVGVGPLAATLSEALARRPERGRFHGYLPDEQLADFLCSMDVLINPHRDIAAVGHGVFPFKLFEYVAAGAVVVTTPLPTIEGLSLERLIHFDGSPEGLAAALAAAARRGAADEDVRREVLRRFGLPAMTALIDRVLDVAAADRRPRPV